MVTLKKLKKFSKGVMIARASADINARFVGKKGNVGLYQAGKTAGSIGVIFTGTELARAKARALKRIFRRKK